MSHFFLHLPSNSSESYYPDNTRSHFITRLLNSIELKGDWEVGLSEILFSKTWFNIKKGEGFKIITNSPHVFSISIREGNYATIEEVVNELNARTRQYAEMSTSPLASIIDKWPTFGYNANNNKVEVGIVKGLQVTFTEGLCRLLGFRKRSMPIGVDGGSEYSIVESDKTADINDGLEVFYIYCDILEYIPVGHTEAPLLRIVDSGSENLGSLVRRHYETPIYIPIQKKNFDSIEIDIRTDRGKPVPFERGKVIVTLHFRKSNGNYFI